MSNSREVTLLNGADSPIHIYVHWCGDRLPDFVASALDRGRERWGDGDYLARIIASEIFVAAGINSTAGAGLSATETDRHRHR